MNLAKPGRLLLGSGPALMATALFAFLWFSGSLSPSPMVVAVGLTMSLLGLLPLLLRFLHREGAAIADAGWRERIAATTFERAADGFCVFDDKGMVIANDAALAMFGASRRDQVEGVHPASFSPEFQKDGRTSAERAAEEIGLTIKNGTNRFEWTHCRLDGVPFDVLVTLVALEIRGRPLIACYWQDITDRVKARKAEEEERRATAARRQREAAVAQEIVKLVDAVAAGDLSSRLDLADKDGFYQTMSAGINRLTDTVQTAISDIARVVGALAEGDLNQRITKTYQGAFDNLKSDVNTTSAKLHEIVGAIGEATEAISQAATEVSLGSTDLAERTEEQASSLEQTAASMEELGATVRTSAKHAQRANTMAANAQSAAKQGGVVAESAIDAMKHIAEASRRITDIIGVIDEIAFQTNLLALNAAVEAARAGDAGKGFAVVAQEVRVLAQRSAQASKEIKTLILNSDNQVQNGVELVKNAGESLGGIAKDVQQVAALISEIAAASSEQASALDQINASVASMDEMTQKNAALVEETSAAAQAMAEQTSGLRQQVAFFKFTGARQGAAPVTRRQAPTAKPSESPALRHAKNAQRDRTGNKV